MGYGGISVWELLLLLTTIILIIGSFVGFRVIGRSGLLGSRRRPAPTAGGPLDLSSLFTPRNETNSFSSAQRIRDEACDLLAAKAREVGWEIIEQRSQVYSANVWFRIDYLLPSDRPDLSLLASVAVDIERFDFHRFEHTCTVTVQVGSRKKTIAGVIALDENAIERIHKYIQRPGKKLKLPNRVRQWPWELWRPRNKITRLRPDWYTIGLSILALVLIMVLPIVGIFLALGILAWLYIRSRKRNTYVLTSGKPLKDPRNLQWMDSWQASIGGLGPVAPVIKDGIISRLRNDAPDDTVVEVETIGYWGTDRWIEREQIAITSRRAIGYVHVVAYGDTLYVAWECYLNMASWVEKKLAVGVDRVSRESVVANGVVSGWHQLNEYDLSDSNFLAEFIHEAVKREVKLRMAEHEIDQEIDFTVQRESRKDALGSAEAGDKPRKTAKTSRFKRLA